MAKKSLSKREYMGIKHALFTSQLNEIQFIKTIWAHEIHSMENKNKAKIQNCAYNSHVNNDFLFKLLPSFDEMNARWQNSEIYSNVYIYTSII